MIESVVVVDDHKLLAETVVQLLQGSGVKAVAFAPQSADQILAEIVAARPSAVLIDFSLGPNVGTATPIVRELTQRAIPTVVVTGNADPLVHAECLEAGAAGVVSKGSSAGELLRALEKAHAGERLLDDNRRHQLLADLRKHRSAHRRDSARFEGLSPREEQVLLYICDGKSAAEIAEASFVSVATVRSQIRAILMKLDVSSQLAAVAEAHRTGWVDRTRADSSNLAM